MCDVDKVIQIDELPDDVLLEIFDFYMGVNPYYNTDRTIAYVKSASQALRIGNYKKSW